MRRFFLIGGFLACWPSSTPAAPIDLVGERRPWFPREVEAALKAIQEKPAVPQKEPLFIDNKLFNRIELEDARRRLVISSLETCRHEINLLARTRADVDGELMQIAKASARLCVRYRAVCVLIERRHQPVVAVLQQMIVSDDLEERYLGWDSYVDALRENQLAPPIDFRQFIDHYENEDDLSIVEQIEWFFGEANARPAAPAILKRLQDGTTDKGAALWALGKLRVPATVPTLIRMADRNPQHEYSVLDALGAIGTDEAIDYLIEVDAQDQLVKCRSRRALPVLKKRIAGIEKEIANENDTWRAQSARHRLAEMKVAAAWLHEKQPVDALLSLAENEGECAEVRWEAILSLAKEKRDASQDRVLKLYFASDDDSFRMACVLLLRTCDSPAFVEALTKQLVHYKLPLCIKSDPQYSVIDVLRERCALDIDESECNWDYMKAYMRRAVAKPHRAEGRGGEPARAGVGRGPSPQAERPPTASLLCGAFSQRIDLVDLVENNHNKEGRTRNAGWAAGPGRR